MVKSIISFPTISDRTYATFDDGNEDAHQKMNFTVGELLNLVHPKVDGDALEFGGVFNVRFNYVCNVDMKDGCKPSVIVQRLDSKSKIGFATRYAHYFYSEEEGKG